MMMPMLVVLWSIALAATYRGRSTRNGTEDDRVGTNIAVAMPYRNTSRYSMSTVKTSIERIQGINPMRIPRVTSVTIKMTFLGSLSTVTPMSGPNKMGESVWSKPITLVLSAEPVTEYTNQRSARRLTPSATCDNT